MFRIGRLCAAVFAHRRHITTAVGSHPGVATQWRSTKQHRSKNMQQFNDRTTKVVVKRHAAPQNGYEWGRLGLALHKGSKAVFDGVGEVGRYDCLLRAVQLGDRKFAAVWKLLGDCMQQRNIESVSVANERVDAAGCFVRALGSGDIDDGTTWGSLGLCLTGGRVVSVDGVGEVGRYECLLRAVQLGDRKFAAVWKLLGDCMQQRNIEGVSVANERVDAAGCFVRALGSGAIDDGKAWSRLGLCLTGGRVVSVDGVGEVGRYECLLRAVQLGNRKYAAVWIRLGYCLQQRKIEGVSVANERVDAAGCFVRALGSGDIDDGTTWGSLGLCLTGGRVVSVDGVGEVGRYECLLRAVQLGNRKYAAVWKLLGDCMQQRNIESVSVANERVDAAGCFVRALGSGAIDDGKAWSRLGLCLTGGRVVSVDGVGEVGRYECLLRAVPSDRTKGCK